MRLEEYLIDTLMELPLAFFSHRRSHLGVLLMQTTKQERNRFLGFFYIAIMVSFYGMCMLLGGIGSPGAKFICAAFTMSFFTFWGCVDA